MDINELANFHFIRPLWLTAMLPALLVLWLLNRQKVRSNGWQKIIPPHLVNYLVQGEKATRHQPFWLLALVWLIIVTALAGPTWEKLPQPVYQTNTGKVIVLDMSMSMRATDIKPNRLTKARFKAMDLIEKIDDSDMGLVAYAGDAFVISPLTTDSKNLTTLIPNLSPEIMPVPGSDPLAALTTADELLNNAGYANGEIFLITDGIEQSEIRELQNFVRSNNHRLSILGVGTNEGAPIKQTNGELLKDARGSIVIPKLNDGSLRQVARSSGGIYTRLSNNDADIEKLALQKVVSHEAKKDDNQLHQGDQWKEFGPFLVMLILPFAAYAFRRGLVVCAVLGLSMAPAKQAHADWWQDMWQTSDQQAQKQFKQDNFGDAASQFKDPQWRGSSLYKDGDYEGALAEFEKNKDASGLYNQGNAQAQLQNLDEAIKAYEEALKLDPDMEDAKKNLELVKQMKEQQQKQENQDQNQQDQDQEKQDSEDQEKQDSESQDGEQSDEEKEQQESEEQQDSENQEQKPEPREGEQNEEADNEPEAKEQPEKSDEEKEAEEKEAQEQEAKESEEEGEEGEEQQQLSQVPEPTTEEKEQQQEIQQLLRKIPDNPSILLRNKMRLEYQKRKQQALPPGAKKSW